MLSSIAFASGARWAPPTGRVEFKATFASEHASGAAAMSASGSLKRRGG